MSTTRAHKQAVRLLLEFCRYISGPSERRSIVAGVTVRIAIFVNITFLCGNGMLEWGARQGKTRQGMIVMVWWKRKINRNMQSLRTDVLTHIHFFPHNVTGMAKTSGTWEAVN